MISYNPKNWILFIFNFHKADTVRKLFPLMLLIALYSYGIAYLEMDYLQLSDNNYQLKQHPQYSEDLKSYLKKKLMQQKF